MIVKTVWGADGTDTETAGDISDMYPMCIVWVDERSHMKKNIFFFLMYGKHLRLIFVIIQNSFSDPVVK